MRIYNPGPEDYHTHTITFSDGVNSIDEMVVHAGKIGLKAIGITDHSQATADYYFKKHGMGGKTFRGRIKRWKNIHNDVKVFFGIEGDLLNEEGDICSDIHGQEATDILILSLHKEIYTGDVSKVTQAYIKAIERHHERITFIGHPCADYWKMDKHPLDIDEVIRAANDYGIPMEFDCSNLFVNKCTDVEMLERVLEKADLLIVNSDAHTLYELEEMRGMGFYWLQQQGHTFSEVELEELSKWLYVDTGSK